MRGVVIALGLMAAAALPASAQRAAAEIALVESAAPVGAVVLGEVRAEIHQTSLFAKTPARDLADKELRTQAAKLGADAVVDVRYENSSPLLSKKGFRAAGKAVKFNQTPVQVAAAPAAPSVEAAAAPTPQPPPVVQPLQAELAPPAAPQIQIAEAPPAVPAPPVAASVAPSQAVASPPPQAPAAPPVVAQQAQAVPVMAATPPPAPRGPTPEALIVLTEEDLAGRAYDRLSEVQTETRQTSLFPKKSARAMLDDQLRAKAAALGADAVILIRYENYSPLFSKKGASASGIAVKYR